MSAASPSPRPSPESGEGEGQAARLFLDGRVTLHPGDCRAMIKRIPSGSIDSVVTDPPYALVSIGKRFGKDGAAPSKPGKTGAYARASAGFMGKAWDTGEVAFDPDFWAEVLRVLKPGGHVVAFGGTRSYGHLQIAIEAAGFEVRDSILDMVAADDPVRLFLESLTDEQARAFLRCIDDSRFGGLLAWVYGSGFPKSHDVSKAIDKHNGDARPVVGREWVSNDIRGGALLDAAQEGLRPGFERDITSAAWEGWGTALKPAWEPIVLARKPLAGTVAETVLAHGTGALNIDGCRIAVGDGDRLVSFDREPGNVSRENWRMGTCVGGGKTVDYGRWPANIVHDGSAEVLGAFPSSDGQRAAVGPQHGAKDSVNTFGDYGPRDLTLPRNDSGSAARFFYSAKADASDRIGSKHPTVKPVDLMQWLCRLVTPPGGTVLDPFAGTGSTGEAAWREGFSAVLIEREAEYQVDIARRMALCLAGPDERARESLKARGRVAADAGPLFGGAAEAKGGGGGRSTAPSLATDDRPRRAQAVKV